MSSLQHRGVRFDRNPQFRSGLSALVEFLADAHYSARAIADIYDHVAVTGTLAGSDIEPEDEAAAESIFVDNLPELPQSSDAWGRPGVFLDVEMLAAGTHPRPIGDGPDLDCGAATDELWRHPRHRALVAAGIAPIAGGAPTEADVAEAMAHCGRMDMLDDIRRAEDARNPVYGYE